GDQEDYNNEYQRGGTLEGPSLSGADTRNKLDVADLLWRSTEPNQTKGKGSGKNSKKCGGNHSRLGCVMFHLLTAAHCFAHTTTPQNVDCPTCGTKRGSIKIRREGVSGQVWICADLIAKWR
ncbi:unnamed protein product, partial [Amoebophrya sp. A25]